ncbi:hypothetical protein [Tuberibacillus sp. Marseille-P3662]|uniref:hypothetical protein n=1 Tax=Tuberibacillus sp. Marseille-P3662 TaxID=1965358 RepID=UPI00111C0E77|nr:hypothetical protein [Tuberibacillus sp. Marseille-P3662]
MFELGRYRFCFAVSRNHLLAPYKSLSIKDLYGEKVAVVNGGESTVIDEIRDSLIRNHPQIQIKDVLRSDAILALILVREKRPFDEDCHSVTFLKSVSISRF